MNPRQFFMANPEFKDLNPEMQQLISESLDYLEEDPSRFIIGMVMTYMKRPDRQQTSFLMGILIGMASTDERVKFKPPGGA